MALRFPSGLIFLMGLNGSLALVEYSHFRLFPLVGDLAFFKSVVCCVITMGISCLCGLSCWQHASHTGCLLESLGSWTPGGSKISLGLREYWVGLTSSHKVPNKS